MILLLLFLQEPLLSASYIQQLNYTSFDMSSGEYQSNVQYKQFGVQSIVIPIDLFDKGDLYKIDRVQLRINQKKESNLRPGVNNFATTFWVSGSIVSFELICYDSDLKVRNWYFTYTDNPVNHLYPFLAGSYWIFDGYVEDFNNNFVSVQVLEKDNIKEKFVFQYIPLDIKYQSQMLSCDARGILEECTDYLEFTKISNVFYLSVDFQNIKNKLLMVYSFYGQSKANLRPFLLFSEKKDDLFSIEKIKNLDFLNGLTSSIIKNTDSVLLEWKNMTSLDIGLTEIKYYATILNTYPGHVSHSYPNIMFNQIFGDHTEETYFFEQHSDDTMKAVNQTLFNDYLGNQFSVSKLGTNTIFYDYGIKNIAITGDYQFRTISWALSLIFVILGIIYAVLGNIAIIKIKKKSKADPNWPKVKESRKCLLKRKDDERKLEEEWKQKREGKQSFDFTIPVSETIRKTQEKRKKMSIVPGDHTLKNIFKKINYGNVSPVKSLQGKHSNIDNIFENQKPGRSKFTRRIGTIKEEDERISSSYLKKSESSYSNKINRAIFLKDISIIDVNSAYLDEEEYKSGQELEDNNSIEEFHILPLVMNKSIFEKRSRNSMGSEILQDEIIVSKEIKPSFFIEEKNITPIKEDLSANLSLTEEKKAESEQKINTKSTKEVSQKDIVIDTSNLVTSQILNNATSYMANGLPELNKPEKETDRKLMQEHERDNNNDFFMEKPKSDHNLKIINEQESAKTEDSKSVTLNRQTVIKLMASSVHKLHGLQDMNEMEHITPNVTKSVKHAKVFAQALLEASAKRFNFKAESTISDREQSYSLSSSQEDSEEESDSEDEQLDLKLLNKNKTRPKMKALNQHKKIELLLDENNNLLEYNVTNENQIDENMMEDQSIEVSQNDMFDIKEQVEFDSMNNLDVHIEEIPSEGKSEDDIPSEGKSQDDVPSEGKDEDISYIKDMKRTISFGNREKYGE